MSAKFGDKSAKIITVDSSGSSRQLLADILKGVGFTDITGVASGKDILGILEVETVDWIIMPMDKTEEINAFHILRLITKFKELKHARVSVLFEDDDKEFIASAYSYGMISHHSKPFTKDSLTADIQNFMSDFESKGWDSCLTASGNLGTHLKEASRNDEWLALSKSMIETYPGNSKIILDMAEPLFANGNKEEGKKILRQVKLMDDTLADSVVQINETYGGGESLEGETADGANLLGIEKVVVIDPDSTVQKSITEFLGEIGITDVKCIDDGEAALAHLKENPNPGLIIQEWRIPKIAGPLLLQMIRKQGTTETPVLVLSSLLTKEDGPLVREMGVASLVDKPFDKKEFLKQVMWTVQQDKMPTDQFAMERKIREYLLNKKLTKATELKSKYVSDPGISDGKKKLIEAEFAFATNDFEAAKVFGFDALKHGGESFLILNLLGKTLMKLNDFPSALKCLERAQLQSPLNIERLCRIAEAHQEMGNEEKAEETLDKAKEIEEKHAEIKETETKIALSAGDTDKARTLMNQLDSLGDLIAYMNNKAVALARSGDIDAGVNEYRKTIKALPEEKAELRGVVYYNLGLAYARNGDLEEAKLSLDKAIAENTPIKKKAESLFRRIDRALEKGEEFTLESDEPTNIRSNEGAASNDDVKNEAATDNKETAANASETNDANEAVVAAFQSQKGEIGCYMIFHEANVPESVTKVLTPLPRVNIRAAISREASFGADKLMAG